MQEKESLASAATSINLQQLIQGFLSMPIIVPVLGMQILVSGFGRSLIS